MSGEGLREVVAGGVRLASLRALRDAIAGDLAACESMRDKSALYQRLMDVLSQIDAAEKSEPVKKGTPLDELTAKRAARSSG